MAPQQQQQMGLVAAMGPAGNGRVRAVSSSAGQMQQQQQQQLDSMLVM
jgi:hypothetical protein